MKRTISAFCILLALATFGWSAYRSREAAGAPLSKFVPTGPLLYLEAKDFSNLLSDWNSSPQKSQWVKSKSYETFSRSRLFLRLKGAGDQFALAAGLPPDESFLSQIAGEHSVLAIYDIGKLQFLYITYLPSAKSMQSTLWQTRAKFEPRTAAGAEFYLRRDPASQREVAFAIAGDYFLLATREDLIAGALQLISGSSDLSVEKDPWWAQSTEAAGPAGDLRLVLDMARLVPNGYFRTYWVQQNIMDLSQYSAGVSDLFRSNKQYREERLLIRKQAPEQAASPESLAAAADLAGLVPADAGVYIASANPSSDACLALLENKLLAPHVTPAPASQLSPQIQLNAGEQGTGSDLETRIDEPPVDRALASQSNSALKQLLSKTPLLASLQVESTSREKEAVFVHIHSAVAFVASTNWDEAAVQSALRDAVRSSFTASQLGFAWQQKSEYVQLDGLWPLTVAVRGKYLLVDDDPTLMESMLANLGRTSERKPALLLAAFNHQDEHSNFARLFTFIDWPGAEGRAPGFQNVSHQPQFFSGNIASLSQTLAAVSSEQIEIRSEGDTMRQTVIYQWSE